MGTDGQDREKATGQQSPSDSVHLLLILHMIKGICLQYSLQCHHKANIIHEKHLKLYLVSSKRTTGVGTLSASLSAVAAAAAAWTTESSGVIHFSCFS